MSLLKPVTIRDIAGDPLNWITPITAGMGLRLRGATSGYVGLKAPATGAAVDFTLPSADGASGQAIITNGSGVLSFGSFAATNHNHDGVYSPVGHDHAGVYQPLATVLTSLSALANASGVLTNDGSGNLSWAAGGGGVTDHGALTGLSDDDHSIYALLAGRAGGQTLIGGTASGENLTLSSTSHGTKGKILFGTSGYDQVNNRLGIGTANPSYPLHVVGTTYITGGILLPGSSGGYSSITQGTWGYLHLSESGDVTSCGWGIGSTYAAIWTGDINTGTSGQIFFGSTTTFSRAGTNANAVITSAGAMGLGKLSSLGARLHVVATNASTIGLMVDGAASQSANLLEIRNSGGNKGWFIAPHGSYYSSGWMYLHHGDTNWGFGMELTTNVGVTTTGSNKLRVKIFPSGVARGGAQSAWSVESSASLFQVSDTGHVWASGAFCGSYGVGADSAGGNLTLEGGPGRGTGAGGSVLIKIAPAGSTGASLNSLVTLVTLDSGKTITLADAANLVFNTTTGTKIGTGTTQKLAFWNATPVVQPASANQAALTDSTGGTADGTVSAVSGSGDDATINNNFKEVLTLLNQLRSDLVTMGLIKGAA